SSPTSFRPQQRIVPSVMRAHVCESPLETSAAPPLRAWTGAKLFVVDPLPSCPRELVPQQRTAPAVVRTQVNDVPHETSATPVKTAPVPVRTGSGTALWGVDPGSRASCPWLLSPQQETVPFVKRAHVWKYPAEIWAMQGWQVLLVEEQFQKEPH